MGTSKALTARPNGMTDTGIDDAWLNNVVEPIDTIVIAAEPTGLLASIARLGCDPPRRARATITVSTLDETEHSITWPRDAAPTALDVIQSGIPVMPQAPPVRLSEPLVPTGTRP